VLAVALSVCCTLFTPLHATPQLGSCNKVDLPQKFWGEITRRAPAAWIWMGDNVYADTKRKTLADAAKEFYNRCVIS
jgi:alkaline phosphatase D